MIGTYSTGQDPINFDADPDPGSELEKMDPDPNPEIFLQFLVDIRPLGSVSVDPHIFADPDPGSQNLADPTDPDPKHWYIFSPHVFFILTVRFCIFLFPLIFN